MLSLSLINPLRYTEYGYSDSYNTKYFDLYPYVETIQDFEEQADYFQPFCKSDPLVHQVIGEVLSTVTLNIYDCSGKLVLTDNFTKVFNVTYPSNTVFGVFQHSADLSSLSEGAYYVEITDGDTTIPANKIDLKTSHPGTVLIKYRNYKHYQDAIFEKDSTFYFYLRVQGFIVHNLPERVSTTYEDQVLNMTALRNVPYNSWSFITDTSGLPTYMIDLLNRVFGCSTLYIDGRLFTVSQDSKWEEKAEEYYPLRGWGIDLREKIIQTSLEYDGTTGGGGGTPPSTIHDIDSDWWTGTAGQHTIPLTDVGYKGREVSEIYKLIMVSRSGNPYRVVDTTPSNDEVQLHPVNGIVFDSSIPFNSGETVTAIFEVV